jgi:hypothetical protein
MILRRYRSLREREAGITLVDFAGEETISVDV